MKTVDPSAKCLKAAELPDPRFDDGTHKHTVICSKSIAHRDSDRPDRRRHYDPSFDVYWTDEEAL